MGLLSIPPLGDTSNTTMYLLLGVAVVCVIAIGAMLLLPKRSKKEEDDEGTHVEEISEE